MRGWLWKRVQTVMLFAGTEQVIRVLVGIKRNGFAICNLASCNSVGRLETKAFPARNLTVIKDQRHEGHRFEALDSDDLKYHGGRRNGASVGLQFFEVANDFSEFAFTD